MKTQTRDALLAICEGIFRQQAELSRKVRIMELLLSRRDAALYQEYMDQVTAAGTHQLPENVQKDLEVFRQTLLQDRE